MQPVQQQYLQPKEEENPEKNFVEFCQEIQKSDQQPLPHQLSQLPLSEFGQKSEVTPNGICKQFLHYNKCIRGKNCPYSHDLSKSRPCIPFQQGYCKKGDDCDFSHQQEFKKKNPLCQDYLIFGICKNEQCTFRHKILPCTDYLKGFCPKGSGKCFQTTKDNLEIELAHITKKVCLNYLYGFCPFGPDCTDYHLKIFIDEDAQSISNGNTNKVIKCNKCKEIGHKSNNCFYSQELDEDTEIYCLTCKKKHPLNYKCNSVL